MNIVNESVQHIVFGKGTVVSLLDGKLSVEFSSEYGVKQFLYPDAFEKFLKLNNSDLESTVMGDLHNKQLLQETERLQKQKELDEANKILALEKAKSSTQKRKTATRNRKSVKSVIASDESEELAE